MFWTMKVWDLFISSVFYFLEDLFGKLEWQSLFLWSRTQKLFGMIWKVVKITKISEKNWEYTISSGPPLTLDWRAQTVPAKTDQKKRIEVHTHTHTTHSITHTHTTQSRAQKGSLSYADLSACALLLYRNAVATGQKLECAIGDRFPSVVRASNDRLR
jgi:hypothetical protein